jgi:methyl-accepting chemotaxis protein
MRNIRIAHKLIASFAVLIAVAIALTVVGIYARANLSGDYTYLLDLQTVQQDAIKSVQLEFMTMRYRAANYVMNGRNAGYINGTARPQFDAAHDSAVTHLNDFIRSNREDARNAGAASNIEGAAKLLELLEGYLPVAESARELSLAGDTAAADAALKSAIPLVDEFEGLAAGLAAASEGYIGTTAESIASSAQNMMALSFGMVIVCAAIAFIYALYISKTISGPLTGLVGYMKRAGDTGNLMLHDDEWAECDRLSEAKDETGQIMKAFARMMRKFVYYGEALNAVAGNDLTVTVETLGEADTFGNAIKTMVESLNAMFSAISEASGQVSGGSVQISDGAQLLAQGAVEQSATVEDLSVSVSAVNGQTKANAALADEAKKLGEEIRANAERGSGQMEQMIKAVGEISDASMAIGRVIKIIDDIAFQTNILALNAAVEAARAGQHGKGFAVVADEVRSLAAKSADAAKNTNALIAASIAKAEHGAATSKETAESLGHIVSGIVASSELVAKIARASGEQSAAFGRIGEAIGQVSQVIQQNSATAEESAAASEEMSAQAAMLRQLISQFKLASR